MKKALASADKAKPAKPRARLAKVVVVREGLPFEVKLPNATTRAAMQEARAMRKAKFDSAQALFNDLEKTNKAKARKAVAQ